MSCDRPRRARGGRRRPRSIGAALDARRGGSRALTKAVLQMLGDAPEAARAAAFDYMMQTGYCSAAGSWPAAAEVAQQRLAGGSDATSTAQGRDGAFLRRGPAAALRGHAGAIAAAGGALMDYPVDWL
jgi:hypothetical protein